MKKTIFIILGILFLFALNGTVLHPAIDAIYLDNTYDLRISLDYLPLFIPIGISVSLDSLQSMTDYDINGWPIGTGLITHYPYPSQWSGYTAFYIYNIFHDGSFTYNQRKSIELGIEYTLPNTIGIRVNIGANMDNNTVFFVGIGIYGWATTGLVGGL